MSFARAALRITALQALQAGATYANVYDSELAPIDEFAADERLPVISVYTDESKAEQTDISQLPQDVQQLVFEVAITQKAKLPVYDAETNQMVEDQTAWVTPPTDAYMELTLDLICHQIQSALSDDGPWAELYRDMICEIVSVKSMRGMAGPKEDRFAGRQIVYELKLCRAPLTVPESGVFKRFFDLLDADPAYEKTAGLMRDVLSDKAGLDLVKYSYGLTQADSRGLLMEPEVVQEPVE